MTFASCLPDLPRQDCDTSRRGMKAIVGIIRGSGVSDLPGLEDLREDWLAEVARLSSDRNANAHIRIVIQI
jgi:hypothetical protein